MPNESGHIPDALPGLRVSSSREIIIKRLEFAEVDCDVELFVISDC